MASVRLSCPRCGHIHYSMVTYCKNCHYKIYENNAEKATAYVKGMAINFLVLCLLAGVVAVIALIVKAFS